MTPALIPAIDSQRIWPLPYGCQIPGSDPRSQKSRAHFEARQSCVYSLIFFAKVLGINHTPQKPFSDSLQQESSADMYSHNSRIRYKTLHGAMTKLLTNICFRYQPAIHPLPVHCIRQSISELEFPLGRFPHNKRMRYKELRQSFL